MDEFEKQALTEHLRELRNCLIKSLAAVALGFAVCYNYSRGLADHLFKPLAAVLPATSKIIFTSYQEAFFFI